ncbi:MAG: carbamoyltransferase [Planctomycetes bacterium]|nr:carbamoyltransferase [Planctomycetota bacterium]
MTVVVGVNAFHGDAAAAAVRDGHIAGAVAEERFTRRKHQAGFPARALAWAVDEACGGDWRAVEALCVARKPRAYLLRKMLHVLRHPGSAGRALGRIRNLRAVEGLRGRAARELGIGEDQLPPLVGVEHHLAHVASSFFPSPFEEAACLTVDGFGDFVSSMACIARGNDVSVLRRHTWPHSLGLFYTAVTQYLGFPHYGDEYKVMGLAAYGEPRFVRELEQVLHVADDGTFRLDLKYFRHVSEGVDMSWDQGEPVLGDVFTLAWEKLLGTRRGSGDEVAQKHMDLAASAQALYERALVALVRWLLPRAGTRKLCLAGGCAQNSLANGKLYELAGVEELFVQPAAGDDGTSLGAALWHAHVDRGQPRNEVQHTAAYGPKATTTEIEQALRAALPSLNVGGEHDGFSLEVAADDEHLASDTAQALVDGEVVGWFQGRAEWGPRALGQRSILADPRRSDARELLNVRIKRRERFRPFAPSVLAEHLTTWFPTAHPDPFMTQVFPMDAARRDKAPAVVHADGTGRTQCVDRRYAPLYAQLIDAFHERTGVPMVLNTSFNESEPIVNSPAEALDCFLRTNMDRLVMGRHVVRRRGGAAS